MQIAIFIGTRPEYIKCEPLLVSASYYVPVYVEQQKDLLKGCYDPAKDIVISIPDSVAPKNRLNTIMTAIFEAECFLTRKWDAVMVQGDTAVACAAALAAYNHGIPVYHLEAGLRTYDLANPYPEEGYRRMIDAIAHTAFCPAESAAENLRKEGFMGRIAVVGNTVIDAVKKYNLFPIIGKIVIVTLHRRENWELIPAFFRAIEALAEKHTEYDFVIPVHPNPEIQKHALEIFKKVHIIKPIGHELTCRLISEANCIISDSGGIQEEAAYFGKRIFCCRKVTERVDLVDTHITFTPTPELLTQRFAVQTALLDRCKVYGNGDAVRKINMVLNPHSACEVTAIVNVYKRPETLKFQIEAIMAQSIPPKAIFVWNNGNKDVDFSELKTNPLIRIFDNTHNYGVWSRFLIGLMAPTEYICIFDDDTIPGTNWFMNCFESMCRREALYGTIGVVFDNTERYKMAVRYGWDNPMDVEKPVDIVGHSWFFKRDWLSHFVREPPKVYTQISNGEDVHFSHMLQKYAHIPTYVPPHPACDQSLWGSMPKIAWTIGADGNSETMLNFNVHEMFVNNVKNGFRLITQRQHATSVDDFAMFADKIRKRIAFAIIRPADGEYIVLQNQTLTNIDNWTFKADGSLKKDLEGAIDMASRSGCYVGIPCETCNAPMAKWYVDHFQLHPNYTTFANIFVNKNWKSWVALLKEERVPFTYVGPACNTSDFCIQSHIAVSPYLVNEWDTESAAAMERIMDAVGRVSGAMFLFSCGPIAKIFIAHAWKKNPTNIYIDAGSSLDLFMKGSTNRLYTGDDGYATYVCKFTPGLIKIERPARLLDPTCAVFSESAMDNVPS